MLSPQDIPGAAFLQMLLDSCTRVLGVWLSVWGLLVSLAFDHLFLLLWVHTYYIRAQLDVLVGFRTISYETYRSWLGTFQDFFFFFFFGFFFLFFFVFFFFLFRLLPAMFSLCVPVGVQYPMCVRLLGRSGSRESCQSSCISTCRFTLLYRTCLRH